MQPKREVVDMLNTKKLKKMRLERNLTHKEVAIELGISRAMYTLIENGDRNPSIKIMQRIVMLFGDEAKDIFFNNEVA